jgi:hypothetical protein
VDLNFLIGAIIGSGLFITFGHAPAKRLLALVRERAGR